MDLGLRRRFSDYGVDHASLGAEADDGFDDGLKVTEAAVCGFLINIHYLSTCFAENMLCRLGASGFVHDVRWLAGRLWKVRLFRGFEDLRRDESGG